MQMLSWGLQSHIVQMKDFLIVSQFTVAEIAKDGFLQSTILNNILCAILSTHLFSLMRYITSF